MTFEPSLCKARNFKTSRNKSWDISFAFNKLQATGVCWKTQKLVILYVRKALRQKPETEQKSPHLNSDNFPQRIIVLSEQL